MDTRLETLKAGRPPVSEAPRVLIGDDDPDVLTALRLLLKSEGYLTETVQSPAEVLRAADRREFDLVLIDLNYTRDTTSGAEGLDLLEALRKADASLPVVVMTAWGTIELAVEAMRRGARDFLQKPWENQRLLAIVRAQTELAGAMRRNQRLEAENEILRAPGAPRLIAASAAMRPVLELIARVGPSDAHILISGEHGTGKEVVARTLHAVSARAARPLVPVNCGGMPEGLFESEFFGHVRGAFTGAATDRIGRFEAAHTGTLFLDEIANMPLTQQAKLLRVIETGEVERVGSSKPRRVDVRILAATNADLRQEVEAERFRADLLFRLNTVEIRLPPLRDRKEDLPLLARHFLEIYRVRYKKPVRDFTPEALRSLGKHRWPGNVRELDHVVERAVLMAASSEIQPQDLGLEAGWDRRKALDELTLEEVERRLIEKALERASGNVTEAARTLGLSRSGLYRRLQKHGIGT
jgi:DNA-binding NtrC family response regulator